MTAATGAAPPLPLSSRWRSAAGRRLAALLTSGVIAVAAYLLYRSLSRYSLDAILASVAAFPRARLAGVAGFAAASYVCLSGFDWLAVRYAGHPLPYAKTALASFTSLSLGHTIGFAALSSGAIRYRFYARWGLSGLEVAKAILFCAATVALGLTVLAAAALLLRPDLAEAVTGLRGAAVTTLGLMCLAAVLAYLGLAAFARGPLRWRRLTLPLPPLRLALGQVLLGGLNFACVAGALHHALAAVSDVSFPEVAAVYVIANVSAMIAHVPGGLGVIESVVLALLPDGRLIGALLVFRLVYFLIPLALGTVLLALTEARCSRYRRHRHPERPPA